MSDQELELYKDIWGYNHWGFGDLGGSFDPLG